MKLRHGCLLLIYWLVLAGQDVSAQEWTPQRVVGMNYPALAAQSRTQGTVELSCSLDADGAVVGVKVLSANGPNPALLSSAASQNATKWKFRRRNQQEGTASTARLVYIFTMPEQASRERPRSEFAFEYPDSVFVTSETPAIRVTR